MVEVRSQLIRSRYGFANAAQLAFDSIRAHKLRSFLTLLGVIIGVASVILVGAAIEGLGAFAEQTTTQFLGADSYLVGQILSAQRMSRKEFFDRVRRNRQFRMDDLVYLQQVNGDSNLYSAYQQTIQLVEHGDRQADGTSILGASASLAAIRELKLADGRFFTEQEERLKQPVAMIGEEIRTELFGENASVLGQTIKVQGIEFLIIGLQEKLGSAFGRAQDRVVYIPVTMYNRMFGTRGMILYGRARPGAGFGLEESVDLTRAALRSRFHTPIGKEDNFDVLTPEAVRGFVEQILALVAAVVVPVTSISLVVGGIVIMNIMLVSVTERTREIGIRKAVGARRGDIMQQVLIEAVLLAGVGGLLGVGLGALVTTLLSRIFEITMRITWFYVALSIGVSSVVGIVSGWYPAMRASKLDPVVALRAE
jgi:putative ABC transport system permease protein